MNKRVDALGTAFFQECGPRKGEELERRIRRHVLRKKDAKRTRSTVLRERQEELPFQGFANRQDRTFSKVQGTRKGQIEKEKKRRGEKENENQSVKYRNRRRYC